MFDTPKTLLPDEIYCYEMSRNNLTRHGGWHEIEPNPTVYDERTKYIRADLVSTPPSSRANERGDACICSREIDPVAAKAAGKDLEYFEKEFPQTSYETRFASALQMYGKALSEKHTPQPSPAPDMVAVPREVIEKAARVLKVYSDGRETALTSLTADSAHLALQPYTKGEK